MALLQFQPLQVSELAHRPASGGAQNTSLLYRVPTPLPPSPAAALQSVVEVGFWSALGELKLHRLKLQEGPLPLQAHYTPSGHAEFPGFLSVEAAGLSGAAGEGGWEAGPSSSGGGGGGDTPDPAAAAAEAPPQPQPPGRAGQVAVQGELYCLNSVEQLTKFDRKAAAHQVCIYPGGGV